MDGAALPTVGERAGHVRDQQPAQREPPLDIGEVVGGRGGDVAVGQEAQQPQACVVVVVPGVGSGRKASSDEVRAAWRRLGHRVTSRGRRQDIIAGVNEVFALLVRTSPEGE
jgi:hypothetical protein